MRRITLRMFTGLCVILVLSLAPFQGGAAELTAEHLTPLMDEFLQHTQTPGMVAAVLRPGMEKPMVIARGMENVENSVPMRPDNVLCFGSVTKVFTALRAQQAIAAGKLTADTDIRPYFPELNLPAPITVRQLSSHTSGLPELLAQPEVLASPSRVWTAEDLLGVINNKPALFAPGTKQAYNNTGYMLLGMLLDRLGFSTQQWLDENRALMPSLSIKNDVSIVPHKSSGYSRSATGALQLPMLFSSSLSVGAGDLMGNAGDLTRLTGLLKKWNALPAKLEPLRLPDGSEAAKPSNSNGLGYDWCLLETVTLYRVHDGFSVLGKDGMFPGFSSQYFYDPKTDTTLVLLLNQEQACGAAFVLGVRLLESL